MTTAFTALFNIAFAAPATLTQSVTSDGETITLQLTKQNLRGANFELWSQNAAGTYDVVTPVDERSYLGTVDEYPAAVACGIIQDDGKFKGVVYFDRGGTWYILDTAVTGTSGMSQPSTFGLPSYTVSPGQVGTTTYGFDVGIDARYEYFASRGNSSLAKTFEAIEYSVAINRGQYMHDALLQQFLGRVIIRTDAVQCPYAGKTGGTYLDALRTHWNNNHSDADRDVVAGVAPSHVWAGLAWVGVMGSSSAYSVNDSGGDGNFATVWRHELGHNWSLGHYDGGGPEGATINSGNSYARVSGPELHRMINHRDAKLGIFDNLGTYTAVNMAPYAALDSAVFTQGSVVASVTIDAMANDHDANGHTLSIDSFDTTSANGGTITLNGSGSSATFEYSVTGGFSGHDQFSYVIIDSSGQKATGKVVIDVQALELTLVENSANATSVGTVTTRNDHGANPLTAAHADAVMSAYLEAWPRNVMLNGDMHDGDPVLRTGSDIVELTTQQDLIDLGLTRAMEHRAGGNDYLKANLSAGMAGQWVFACMLIYSDDPANMGHSSALYSEISGGGGLSAMTDYEDGLVALTPRLQLLWRKGKVADNTDDALIFGSSFAPEAADLYWADCQIVLTSTEPNADGLVRQRLLTYQALKEAVPTAARAVAKQAALVSYPRVVLGGVGDAETYVESDLSGDLIKRGCRPFRETNINVSRSMDWRFEEVNNSGTLRTGGDDMAPYRVFNPVRTVGANHGYQMGLMTQAGHGKAAVDEGSVWAMGGDEFIILEVRDANTMWMAHRTSDTAPTSGTFTHVSGATNTADIVTTSAVANQWYPPVANYVRKMLVDGVESSATSGSVGYTDTIQFIENYDILPRSEIVDWWENTRLTGEVEPVGGAAFSVSITSEFDRYGGCSIYTDFLVQQDTNVQDIMFLQQSRMRDNVDGAVSYYIPKTLPLNHEGHALDFGRIASADTDAWAGRLSFTSDKTEATGHLADRVLQLTNTYGMAVGYLPVGSTATTNRRENASEKALQISNNDGKIYLSAIDKGTAVVPAGTYYSTIGYRQVFKRETDRTAAYAVRTQGADYFYMDWHDVTKTDRVPLPADFAGREFEVVESRNTTLHTQTLTNSVVVAVAATGDYGFLVLKVSK